MQRTYVIGLTGLLFLAACLDRKTGNAVDGATFPDSAVTEVARLPGTGGAAGVDLGPGPDGRLLDDHPKTPDLPIVSSDAMQGGGGVVGTGTGGSLLGGTGGIQGDGGALLPGSGGGTAGVLAGTGGMLGSGGTVVAGTGGAGRGGAGSGGRSGAGGATTNPDAPPALLPNGTACTAAGTACASGNCVDGVCCNNPCTGCKSCKATYTGEADGLCAFVKAGVDPHDTCADETTTNQCGNDGQCDGGGGCRKVGTSHQCSGASCDGGFTPASFCTGTGACTPVTAQPCGAFQCSLTEGCKTTCTSQGDCGGQAYCNTATGSCLAKTATGGACTQPVACTSGSCVDGVCCENACTGTCKACTAAKTSASDGLCRPVKVGTDPDSECAVDTGNACGLDGTCDGVSACRYQVTGTRCGTASCTGQGSYTPRGDCDGHGACVPGVSRDCANHMLCNSNTECATTCTDLSTTGCPSGYRCAGGYNCVAATVPCGVDGQTLCSIQSGGVCQYSNYVRAYCAQTGTGSFIPCNSRAECPSGQYCCIEGNSMCMAGGWDVSCRTDTSHCVSHGSVDAFHLCDPTLGSADCPGGTTCQTLLDCLPGIYACL